MVSLCLLLSSHLERSLGGGEEVDGVCRHPDHGREADHEAEGLAPPGVLVRLGVLDRRVLDEVEQEDELESRGGDRAIRKARAVAAE